MSDINAAPSSTEPAVTGEPLPPSDNPLTQEAGVAASGEPSTTGVVDAATATVGDAGIAPSLNTIAPASADKPEAPAIDTGAHLSRLDRMLAEIERKIAAGIHLFAHEVTAARDHLAKLL
ncbi:MAG: hypothetical protein QJR04_09540 [Burkholderia multivorans]|nr:hypothetical protein [Burkholderia multivorans]